MAKSLKDKDLIGEIADIYQDGTLRRGTFDYRDVKEALLEDKKNLTKYESGLITFDKYLSRRKQIFGDWTNK